MGAAAPNTPPPNTFVFAFVVVPFVPLDTAPPPPKIDGPPAAAAPNGEPCGVVVPVAPNPFVAPPLFCC